MAHTIKYNPKGAEKHYTKGDLILKARLNDRKVVSEYAKFIGGVK